MAEISVQEARDVLGELFDVLESWSRRLEVIASGLSGARYDVATDEPENAAALVQSLCQSMLQDELPALRALVRRALG